MLLRQLLRCGVGFDLYPAGASVMQIAAMKDVTAAARALRQASASVKQLAQCRQVGVGVGAGLFVLILLQAGCVGSLERASHDCAGVACDRCMPLSFHVVVHHTADFSGAGCARDVCHQRQRCHGNHEQGHFSPHYVCTVHPTKVCCRSMCNVVTPRTPGAEGRKRRRRRHPLAA